MRFFERQDCEFHANCVVCGVNTCLGCGEEIAPQTIKSHATTIHGQDFIWHCDGARLALIWALTVGYDDRVDRNKISATTANPGTSSPAKKRGKNTSGTGYSPEDDHYSEQQSYEDEILISSIPNSPSPPSVSDNAKLLSTHPPTTSWMSAAAPASLLTSSPGHTAANIDEVLQTGTFSSAAQPPAASGPSKQEKGKPHAYGSFPKSILSDYGYPSLPSSLTSSLRKREKTYKRSRSPERVDPDDDPIKKTLAALAVLLPEPSRSSATNFDRHPYPALRSILTCSSLLHKATGLLRNMSLEDATKR